MSTGSPSGRWARGAAAVPAAVLLVVVATLVLPTSLGGRTGFTIVAGRSMEPTIDSGDLVITRTKPAYEVGDVVVYRIPDGAPGEGVKVVHRITGGSAEEGFVTAGDNRARADVWRPTAADIIGAHWRTLPAAGNLLLWFRSPMWIAMVLTGIAFRWCLTRTPREDPAPVPAAIPATERRDPHPADGYESPRRAERTNRPLFVPEHPGGADLVRPFTLPRRRAAHVDGAGPASGDLSRADRGRREPTGAMPPGERRAVTELLVAILAMPTDPTRRRNQGDAVSVRGDRPIRAVPPGPAADGATARHARIGS